MNSKNIFKHSQTISSSAIPDPQEAFVWIWLPDETTPVVAGRLESMDNTSIQFNYGQSYLTRKNKIALYDKELPLVKGRIPLRNGLSIPGVIRDAAPDAWGRRVIINKKFGQKSFSMDTIELSEMIYLLESGSDRIGALDFQSSPQQYTARETGHSTLASLVTATELVEKGIPLPVDLALALYHGSAIGGARPKALIEDQCKKIKFIAKFSSSDDTYNVIKSEFIAMKLAKLCNINTAEVHQVKALHKDVLLIERFDRKFTKKGWVRKGLISALSLLALDENFARYASYQDLIEIIRKEFTKPQQTIRELYARLVFNILVGNTDDHARNHAAFWDGKFLTLTPAYDICPQPRTGGIANQAMLIMDNNKKSQILSCLNASSIFMLSETEAIEIIENQMYTILKKWNEVCEQAEISKIDKKLLMNTSFFNPYIIEDLPEKLGYLRKIVMDFKNPT